MNNFKRSFLAIFLFVLIGCGSSETIPSTPTPVPTPTPEGYPQIFKEIFYELCPESNKEFCECSVKEIEENISPDDFPIDYLMEQMMIGNIGEGTDLADLISSDVFPAGLMEVIAPCSITLIDTQVIEDSQDVEKKVPIEIDIAEDLEGLTKEEMLIPIAEVCETNGSEKFCKCTTEAIISNFTEEEILIMAKSIDEGDLPPEIFQMGMINCAIYLGQ